MRFKSLFAGLTVLALAPLPAAAVEATWSGFGTLGYAQSDQPFAYQRFIDDSGSFKRDSILGMQLDASFSRQWRATVQAKLAPSDHSDARWQATLAWAFLSWRPTDDWLIRAGKIRLPLMLNTENNDVGATFDFARLPQEVYSISPLTDVVGLGVGKTWLGENFDWILDAYWGKANTYWRYYGREITPDRNAPGSYFLPVNIESGGLVLTARSFDDVFRIGVHEVVASRSGAKIGAPIVYTPLGGGAGVYSLGSGGSDRVRIPLYTLGASVLLPGDFRVSGEYARISIDSASEGLNRWGAYLALSKRIGAWTPYVYVAKLKSTARALDRYRQINGNVLPAPYASFNPSQKLLADVIDPFDQSTTALGTSYRLTTRSMIKSEWSQVHTGTASSLIDAPSGSDSAHRRINVFSLSYSFSF